jgi:hypothetical protein
MRTVEIAANLEKQRCQALFHILPPGVCEPTGFAAVGGDPSECESRRMTAPLFRPSVSDFT